MANELDFGTGIALIKGLGGKPTDAQVTSAVDAWLDAHPEATTTVEDGSITKAKLDSNLQGTVDDVGDLKTAVTNLGNAVEMLDEGSLSASAANLGEIPLANGDGTWSWKELGYVTPEMFGAKGDGVADDTQAWQAAIDSEYPICATKATYKCGTINVYNDKVIDCNFASFICTSSVLFNCTGSIVSTIESEADYNAMDSAYTITNTVYSNYTGLAMLRGTNNFEKSRSYYKGGFVGEFVNGVLANIFPCDVTGVEIDIITPVTVNISNITNIAHANPSIDTCGIKIVYGRNCVLNNIKSEKSSGYSFIEYNKSYKCTALNCNIKHEYGSPGTNSYALLILDSEYTTIEKCYIYNKYWHSISTGGNHLVYGTTVKDCVLVSNTTAYDDHENAYGTNIDNCYVHNGLYLGALCTANNVSIYNGGSLSNPVCFVFLMMSSVKQFADYTLSNIKFISNANQESNNVGIKIGVDAQVSSVSNTYYLNKVSLSNIYDCNNAYYGAVSYVINNDNSYWFGLLAVNNCNLNMMACIPSSVTNADCSSYTQQISGCNDRDIKFGDTSTAKHGTIKASNSRIGLMQGNITNLDLNNVVISAYVNHTNVSVSGRVTGNNIIGCISNIILTGSTYVSISNIYNNVINTSTYNKTALNYGKDSSGKVYWQYWDNGAIKTDYSAPAS